MGKSCLWVLGLSGESTSPSDFSSFFFKENQCCVVMGGGGFCIPLGPQYPRNLNAYFHS